MEEHFLTGWCYCVKVDLSQIPRFETPWTSVGPGQSLAQVHLRTLQAQITSLNIPSSNWRSKFSLFCIIQLLFAHTKGTSVPTWTFAPLIIMRMFLEHLWKHPTGNNFWHVSSVLESVISLLVRALCDFSNSIQIMNLPIVLSSMCLCASTFLISGFWITKWFLAQKTTVLLQVEAILPSGWGL